MFVATLVCGRTRNTVITMRTIIDKNGNIVRVPSNSGSSSSSSRRGQSSNSSPRQSNVHTIFSPSSSSSSNSNNNNRSNSRNTGRNAGSNYRSTSNRNARADGVPDNTPPPPEPFLSAARMIGLENSTFSLPGMTNRIYTIVPICAVVAYLLLGLTGVFVVLAFYAFSQRQ